MKRLTPDQIAEAALAGGRAFRRGELAPTDYGTATPYGLAWVAGYYAAQVEVLQLQLRVLTDEHRAELKDLLDKHYLVRKP